MPLEYRRDDAARVVVFTAHGQVTVDEWRAAVERQIQEGCWGYGLLYDARERTNIHERPEVERILSIVRKLIQAHGPRGPVAYVATHPAAYGMSRMYGLLAQELSFDYESFQDLDSARAWLAERLASGGQAP